MGHACTNGCNLPMMDLGQVTTGLGRTTTNLGSAKIGLRLEMMGHRRATTDCAKAMTGREQAHSSTPICTYTHPQFIRARRLVLDTRPYFSCFCFQICLAKRLRLCTTTFMCDHLCAQLHLHATTSARDYIYARPPQRATTFTSDDM